MNKHLSTPEFTRKPAPPKHSKGWAGWSENDDLLFTCIESTPGKHAKPFGKHHPAMPVTYDAGGTVTPLRTVEHRLDAVA